MINRTFDNQSMGNNCLNKWFIDLCSRECANCLSVCCFLPLSGWMFKNETEKEEEDNELVVEENRSFFTNDFVIINELFEGFTKEEKLRICPLAINGRCLIYEDRPFICRLYTICAWRKPGIKLERGKIKHDSEIYSKRRKINLS